MEGKPDMKILYVDCCISQRGTGSRTARLCEAFLDAARQSAAKPEIETLDLKELEIEPFTVEALNARDALADAGRFEEEVFTLARQFKEADGIVVGAPFWDLSFPAKLRIYQEYISANGLTYYYDEEGPHGNCKASWLVYLTTGGDFAKKGSIGVEYWRQLCEMFGIGNYYSLFAGGLDADPERTEEYMEGTCAEAKALAEKLIS